MRCSTTTRASCLSFSLWRGHRQRVRQGWVVPGRLPCRILVGEDALNGSMKTISSPRGGGREPTSHEPTRRPSPKSARAASVVAAQQRQQAHRRPPTSVVSMSTSWTYDLSLFEFLTTPLCARPSLSPLPLPLPTLSHSHTAMHTSLMPHRHVHDHMHCNRICGTPSFALSCSCPLAHAHARRATSMYYDLRC